MKRLRLDSKRILCARGECRLSLGGRPLFHRAISHGDTVRVAALVPRRLAVTEICCCFLQDGGEVLSRRMRYCGLRGDCDLYEACIDELGRGLFFYSFTAYSAHGPLYGMRDGTANGIAFSRVGAGAHFQLTVTDFAYPAPRWLYGGIIYQIFVDRFARGGRVSCRRDAILRGDWEDGIPQYPAYRGGPLENNEFFGGSLFGIAYRIRYLASLGVNCLYLTPIFEAYSNHRYDTGDYFRVDPLLGGEAGLVALLDAARAHGMRVVLDGVFNHTGSDSIYFNKHGRYDALGAYQSKQSPYYGWYHFFEHPDTYECWWGIDTLPRLRSDVPALRQFFAGEGGVVDRYARLGIGGLRLDVVDELTDDFVADIKKRLSACVADSVLFGEVWEDASHKVAYGVRKRYYEGRELDGVMNYPLREGLLRYLRDADTAGLRYAVCEVLSNMPKRIADGTMNLLGSHDTERVLTALVGEPEDGQAMAWLASARLSPLAYRRGRRLLILAYLVLSTLPGIPTIYYGDEVGLEGYRDPFNRRPYPWHRRDKKLLAAYRRIGAMRRCEPVFCEGSFSLIALTEQLFVFSRSDSDRVVVTAINRGDVGVRLVFSEGATALYGGGGCSCRHTVYPLSGIVVATQSGCRLSAFLDNGERILLCV